MYPGIARADYSSFRVLLYSITNAVMHKSIMAMLPKTAYLGPVSSESNRVRTRIRVSCTCSSCTSFSRWCNSDDILREAALLFSHVSEAPAVAKTDEANNIHNTILILNYRITTYHIPWGSAQGFNILLRPFPCQIMPPPGYS